MVAESTVSELKAKHGEIQGVEIGEHEFLIRAPNLHEFQRFQVNILEGGQKQVYAYRELVASCVVYPVNGELAPLLDKKPALATLLAKPIVDMAGANEEVRVKKL